MIFKKTVHSIKELIFFNRLKFSKKKNFLDSMSILFTLYSMCFFVFLFSNIHSLHLNSLLDFIAYYIGFVFILPIFLSANHSFIYASILQIFKEDTHLNVEKRSFTEYLAENNNELKLFNLFKNK